MSLIKFNTRRRPWLTDTMPSWFDAKEQFADEFFTNEKNLPAMNVKENKNDFQIELAVPGFAKDEIEVSIEDDILQVCAKKSAETVEEDNDYTRKEFSYNEFERRFQLPANVNSGKKVKAAYKNGILKLTLAKSEEVKTPLKKVIEII